jgi:hypothetical protein
MTIKIIGSDDDDDYDSAFGQTVGYAAFTLYFWGLCLEVWIIYQVYRNRGLIAMFDKTLHVILFGITACTLLTVDTQITIFKGFEWGPLLSWVGFAYLTIFLVFPFIKVLISENFHKPTPKIIWISTWAFIIFYVISGFTTVLLHFLLPKYSHEMRVLAMTLFLLSVMVVWISFLAGGFSCTNNLYVVACGIALAGLTLYGTFYFVRGTWARIMELIAQLLIFAMLTLYSCALIRQFKRTFPVVIETKSRIPLVHNYLIVTDGEPLII